MVRSKVRKGFLETRTLLWVEETLAYFALAVATMMILVFRVWQYVYILAFKWFAMHLLLRRDPSMFTMYTRYRKQADRYEPWPMANQRRRLRPVGFGRGTLC